MFDTYHASRKLEMPKAKILMNQKQLTTKLKDIKEIKLKFHYKHSYDYLLQHYCKIRVDKRYQLADWRIRPLPAEMIRYAREDTHYLLYVYDRISVQKFVKKCLLSQDLMMKELPSILNPGKNEDRP